MAQRHAVLPASGHEDPDISIVYGEPILIQGRPDTLTNPIVLVEVLSDATREYDRGEKFSFYQEIPTLRQYVTIEQNETRIETFSLPSIAPEPRILTNLNDTLSLDPVSIMIPVREIYRLVFG
jgi:Uma2 family endonuclease